MQYILNNYHYLFSIIIMMVGIYGMINSSNLVKKLISMSIVQTAVLLFYISIANVSNGFVPIINNDKSLYINPLPHVLMLTAIVVGIATFAVGLAIIVRIKEEYDTTQEDEIG